MEKILHETQQELDELKQESAKWDAVCDSINEVRNQYIWFSIDLTAGLFVFIYFLIKGIEYFFN